MRQEEQQKTLGERTMKKRKCAEITSAAPHGRSVGRHSGTEDEQNTVHNHSALHTQRTRIIRVIAIYMRMAVAVLIVAPTY